MWEKTFLLAMFATLVISFLLFWSSFVPFFVFITNDATLIFYTCLQHIIVTQWTKHKRSTNAEMKFSHLILLRVWSNVVVSGEFFRFIAFSIQPKYSMCRYKCWNGIASCFHDITTCQIVIYSYRGVVQYWLILVAGVFVERLKPNTRYKNWILLLRTSKQKRLKNLVGEKL